MDADDAAVAPTKVVFKKRVVKGQLRASASSSGSVLNEAKRAEEEGGSDDEDDDAEGSNGVDKKTLEDVKFEQQLRRRQMGLDAKLLLKKPVKPAAPSSSSSTSSSATAATTGALFTAAGANADDSIGSLNPHEKIMETYVAEKLGLNKTEGDGSSAPLTADEKLYRVPAEIRALEGRAEDEEEAGSSEAEVGIYAGIAEVSLPASFKLRNLQETELAIRALEAQGKIHHHVQQGGSLRFQHVLPRPSQDKEAGHKRPHVSDGQTNLNRKPGAGQAHDNYVMQQFKKRNMR